MTFSSLLTPMFNLHPRSSLLHLATIRIINSNKQCIHILSWLGSICLFYKPKENSRIHFTSTWLRNHHRFITCSVFPTTSLILQLLISSCCIFFEFEFFSTGFISLHFSIFPFFLDCFAGWFTNPKAYSCFQCIPYETQNNNLLSPTQIYS